MNVFTRKLPAAVIAVAAVVVAASVVAASAASLGTITSPKLDAWSQTNVSKPYTLTDNFSGNGNLAGRVATSGQTWSVHSGSWTTNASTARTDNLSGIKSATVPWMNISSYVQSAYTVANTSTGMGVMMHVNNAGTLGTVLRVSQSGAVQIGQFNGATFTVWASTTGGGVGTNTWRLAYNKTTGVYTASKNGTAVLTYTVPSGSKAAIEANTRVGMYSLGPDGNNRFGPFTAQST